MKKIVLSLLGSLALTGCVVTPYEYDGAQPVIAVGYYDATYGYWTGYGWDLNYYEYGHSGYGHPRYHGSRYVRAPRRVPHRR